MPLSGFAKVTPCCVLPALGIRARLQQACSDDIDHGSFQILVSVNARAPLTHSQSVVLNGIFLNKQVSGLIITHLSPQDLLSTPTS